MGKEKQILGPDGKALITLADLQDEREKHALVRAMDKADETMLSAELQGMDGFAKQFVYGKETKKGWIIGLTVVGTRTVHRKYQGGFTFAPVPAGEHNPQFIEVEYTEQWRGEPEPRPHAYVRCIVKIKGLKTNEESVGISEQPRDMWVWGEERGTGWTERDGFWYQKAQGKAERNAMRKQVPDTVAIDWMYRWMRLVKEGKVQQLQLDESKQVAHEKQAVADDKVADSLRSRLFAIAETAGLNVKAEPGRRAVIAFIEANMKMKLAKMSGTQLRQCGDRLQAFCDKVGKARFTAAVMSAAKGA
jgi:hypothetical protein